MWVLKAELPVLSKLSPLPAGLCMGSSNVAKKIGQRRVFLCLKYVGIFGVDPPPPPAYQVGFLVAQFGKLLCSRYLDTPCQVRSL